MGFDYACKKWFFPKEYYIYIEFVCCDEASVRQSNKMETLSKEGADEE